MPFSLKFDNMDTSAFFFSLLNTSDTPLIFIDKNFEITAFSHKISEIFLKLYNQPLTANVSVLDLLSAHQNVLAEEKSYFERALAGENFTVEKRDDNNDHPYQAHYFPIANAQQVIIGAALMIKNFNFQTQPELVVTSKQLNLALRTAQSGIWKWDLVNQKVEWDEGMYHLFGIAPGSIKPPATAKEFLDSVHPEDQEKVIKTIESSLKEGSTYVIEYRTTWPDNSIHIIYNRSYINRDNEGRPVNLIGLSMDVTKDRQLEQERLIAVEQLHKEKAKFMEEKKYRESLKLLFDDLCHELRNPLHAIIGNIEISQELLQRCEAGIDTGDVSEILRIIISLKETIKSIQTGAEHQGKIINNVLDLSKLQNGYIKLNEDIFNSKNVIESVIFMLKPQMDKKKLTLSLDLANADDMIKGDSIRLSQIMANLISTCINSTDHGKIIVKASLEQCDDNKIKLNVSVADTGVGMMPEEKVDLFRRFSPTASRRGSTGLELFMIRGFIESMGGTIDAESEKWKGTKFNFHIVCKKLSIEERKLAILENQKVSTTIQPILPKNTSAIILIVDDEAINRKILVNVVGKAGFAYIEAVNGRDALEKYKEKNCSLILMDVGMPEMNGIDATIAIRNWEKEKNLPSAQIIGVSGFTDQTDIKKALDAGMDEYLTKPVKPATLLEKLCHYTQKTEETKVAKILKPVLQK